MDPMSSKTRSKPSALDYASPTLPPGRAVMTRGVVLGIGAAVTILIAGLCFGPFFPELFGGMIFDGAIAGIWFGGATIFGAFILRRVTRTPVILRNSEG